MSEEGPGEMAVAILKLYGGADDEAWDLHSFFELVAGDDPDKRGMALDVVDRLVESGYLESRGSDFFTRTTKGGDAAERGELLEWRQAGREEKEGL